MLSLEITEEKHPRQKTNWSQCIPSDSTMTQLSDNFCNENYRRSVGCANCFHGNSNCTVLKMYGTNMSTVTKKTAHGTIHNHINPVMKSKFQRL